jgi:excisionase family DNA binding protein
VNTIYSIRPHALPRPVTALLTVRVAAARLEVSEKTVRRLIQSGQLPALRIGHSLRISEDDLRRYLDSCRQ